MKPRTAEHHLATWHESHRQTLTLGQRAADVLRNAMGSWGFVFGFLAFMGLWMGLNVVGWCIHWDAAPFILLNLMLSTLAGLQGGILLISAKRQDEIAAAMAKNDFDVNVSAKAEIEELSNLLSEVHRMLKENGHD